MIHTILSKEIFTQHVNLSLSLSPIFPFSLLLLCSRSFSVIFHSARILCAIWVNWQACWNIFTRIQRCDRHQRQQHSWLFCCCSFIVCFLCDGLNCSWYDLISLFPLLHNFRGATKLPCIESEKNTCTLIHCCVCVVRVVYCVCADVWTKETQWHTHISVAEGTKRSDFF